MRRWPDDLGRRSLEGQSSTEPVWMLAKRLREGHIYRMTDLQFADEVLDQLQERNPRFHVRAYSFVLQSLHHVVHSLEQPRHISGRELTESVRKVALTEFGPMARTVLEHWGIHSTEDVGSVVFAMVEEGILTKQDEDTLDDFVDVFDFEEAFEADYPWAASS